jgi:hypothetical protein
MVKINKERRRSMNATPHTTQQQKPGGKGGLQTKTKTIARSDETENRLFKRD